MQQHTTSFFITMGADSSSKVQNKFFKMIDPMIFLAIYCEKKKLLQILFFSEKIHSKQSKDSPKLTTIAYNMKQLNLFFYLRNLNIFKFG